jgi:hypothetical protein
MLMILLLLAIANPILAADAVNVKTPGKADNTWKAGFNSNGERIFNTATSERGSIIKSFGIRREDGKKITGPIACVVCHSPDGKGGKQIVNVGDGVMQDMDAKDIRWSVLKERYDSKTFKKAVRSGKYPDGSALKPDMPRYKISDKDLNDLIVFLKKLP